MHDISPFIAAYRIDEPAPGQWRVLCREGRTVAERLELPDATRLVCRLAESDRERLYAAMPALRVVAGQVRGIQEAG